MVTFGVVLINILYFTGELDTSFKELFIIDIVYLVIMSLIFINAEK